MAFELVIKPIVLIDIDEAVIYYEKQLAGLGKRFYYHFLAALEIIHNKPFHYSFVKDPVRRYKIINFPYKIFYVVTSDTIFVIGVAHAKRSSTFIRNRLKLL